GFQARTQLEAMLSVRQIRSVRVWSRSEEKRREFANTCARELGVEVSAEDTAERAIRGADIVVTATNSREPVLGKSWVGPGTHINAMGSNQAKRRELPTDLVLAADLIVVDSLEQARMESGDLLLAMAPEDWPQKSVIELKDARRRIANEATTIFKSNGIAAEDVAAASLVYEKALRLGRGRNLQILGD